MTIWVSLVNNWGWTPSPIAFFLFLQMNFLLCHSLIVLFNSPTNRYLNYFISFNEHISWCEVSALKNIETDYEMCCGICSLLHIYMPVLRSTGKPVLAVTSIKQPTWLKQPNKMFQNIDVLIFTSVEQPPALSSQFLSFLCVAVQHIFDCRYKKVFVQTLTSVARRYKCH